MKSKIIRSSSLFLLGMITMYSYLTSQVRAQSILGQEPKLEWLGSVTLSPLGAGLNMRYRFPKSNFAVSTELSYMNSNTYTYQGSLLSGFGFTTYASAFIHLTTLPSPFAGPSLFDRGMHAHVFIQLSAGPGVNYISDNTWNPEKFRGSANFRTLFGVNADLGGGRYLYVEFGGHASYLPTLHRRRWMAGPMFTLGILLF